MSDRTPEEYRDQAIEDLRSRVGAVTDRALLNVVEYVRSRIEKSKSDSREYARRRLEVYETEMWRRGL